MIYASDGAVVIKYQIAFASSGLIDFGNSTTLITEFPESLLPTKIATKDKN